MENNRGNVKSSQGARVSQTPAVTMNMDHYAILPYLSFPPVGLIEFKEAAEMIDMDSENYNAVDKAESLEALGIAQYFNASFKECTDTLESALALIKRADLTSTGNENGTVSRASMARINTFCGLAWLRLGDLVNAEKYLQPIAASLRGPPPLRNQQLVAAACSNMALIRITQEKLREAIQFAREGMEMAIRLYPRPTSNAAINPPSSNYSDGGPNGSNTSSPNPKFPEHIVCSDLLSHIRVCINVYMRAGEYGKAESLVEDYPFYHREKVILRAGCRFGAGKLKESAAILMEELMRAEKEKEKEKEKERQGRNTPNVDFTIASSSRSSTPMLADANVHMITSTSKPSSPSQRTEQPGRELSTLTAVATAEADDNASITSLTSALGSNASVVSEAVGGGGDNGC